MLLRNRPIDTPAPLVTIDEKRSQFRLIVIIATSLLTVCLVVLYTTSFLLTTSFESLTLLGILLTIYLIFIRQCYICMIGYHQKTIRRRRPSSVRSYSSFRRFHSANGNNNNNMEISITSSDASNLIPEVCHQLNTENSVRENVAQLNRFATETMYVTLPINDGQRSPGPPSYDEVIKMKTKFIPEDKPPNYAEAMKNIVKK